MRLGNHDVIAVDAALLPSADAADRITRLNSLLYAERPEGFLFGPQVVPHVTLAQLYVRRTNLLALIKKLHGVFECVEPLQLLVTRIAERKGVTSLGIERTPKLLRLHAAVMDELKSLSESDGGIEAFCSDSESARETDALYVRDYRKRASYRRYVPHITLGYGHPPAPDVFLEFDSSEAGLYHLGRFCTCRNLLHRWKLR